MTRADQQLITHTLTHRWCVCVQVNESNTDCSTAAALTLERIITDTAATAFGNTGCCFLTVTGKSEPQMDQYSCDSQQMEMLHIITNPCYDAKVLHLLSSSSSSVLGFYPSAVKG